MIAQAEATEPAINAFSYCYFDAALEAAREAEIRYTGRGAPPRALEGLCVTVTDSGNIKGQPISSGSLGSDVAPWTTSLINQRILDPGAVVHDRSTTPELSCAAVTHSRRWEVTRNP